MIRSRLCRIFATAITIGLCFSHSAWGSSLTFALFGDVYMTAEHQGYLKGMLNDMAAKNSALAISTGGIKPVDQGCQDKNLLAAYPVFAQAPLPTFYVPGDAEWAQCNQNNSGNFVPEERLNLLRKNFYQSDRSLGQPSLPLTRQPNYPEHMRWTSGPALFVSINIAGNNNLWTKKTQDTAEYQNRNAAAEAWLTAAFVEARKQELTMLVIVMHGDPAFNSGQDDIPKGYQALHAILKAESETFPGQVLLVHGGNGVHRIDHPLVDHNHLPLQNFTRVETYGDMQQGWVQVRIERNKKGDDDPVHRTEFLFESFPWPPLNMGGEEDSSKPDN